MNTRLLNLFILTVIFLLLLSPAFSGFFQGLQLWLYLLAIWAILIVVLFRLSQNLKSKN